MNVVVSEKNRLGHEQGFDDYSFEVDLDGQFELGVWLVSEQAQGAIQVRINDAEVFAQAPARVKDGSRYWACGSVALTRGLHKLSVKSGQDRRGFILSDDAAIVQGDKADVVWDNQGRKDAFDETMDKKLTEAQRARLVRHGFLMDHEYDAMYCDVPAGVPLGGIGAGKVELTPQGFFTALTTNNNQDCPVYRMPGSYFALQCEGGSGTRTTRLLQTLTTGQPFKPVTDIAADLAFPEARLDYHDAGLPLVASLHAFSAHVPHDTKKSSLPCVFFRFTLANPSSENVTARLLFSWESLINVGGHMILRNQNEDHLLPLVFHTWNSSYAWSIRDRNRQRKITPQDGVGLLFDAEDDRRNPGSFGQHLIWTPEAAQVVSDRDIVADEQAFGQWFEGGCGGEFASAGGAGEFRAGALIVAKEVPANEQVVVDFVLTWHMPRFHDRHNRDISVAYANDFRDAGEVLTYAWRNRDELLAQTAAVRDLLASSSLPHWFCGKLLDSRFVANSNTIFTRDGKFSVNEAPTGMCGCLGTLDQRTASGLFWNKFFPALDAKELELFTLCQGADGSPAHDLGFSEFDLTRRGYAWPDLAAAYVIQVHRHFQNTGDAGFLAFHWPFVKAAIEWAVGLDDTGDAIPTLKPGRGTTYDNQHWDGISSFIATMHEACLTLGADLAQRTGESELYTRWRDLSEKAHASRMKYLWDAKESYFINAYDVKKRERDDSCFISSLAGEWALAAAGVTPRLSRDTITGALRSIRKKNMFEKSMTDQSGRSEKTPVFIQYPLAYYGAIALFNGDSRLAWEFLELQDRMVTTAPSCRYNEVLTYRSKGEARGLPYYMTAPAVWAMLDGLSGVWVDRQRQMLGLAPRRLPDTKKLRIPVFLPAAWFMLEVAPDGACWELTPVKSMEDFVVRELIVDVSSVPPFGSVLVNGAAADYSDCGNGRITVPVALDPGRERLTIEFRNLEHL